MKKIKVILSAAFVFFTCIIFAQPEVEIPNAEPGFCYAKCLIHDEYRTQTDQILVKAASSKVEIIPAKYETVSKQVLVKEAGSRIERIPMEYKTIVHSFVKGCPTGYEPEGDVLVENGNCVRFIPVSAKYEMVTEQVLVKEAATFLEIIPPTYEDITDQILIKAAYTPNQRLLPAQYESVIEQVLVKKASTEIERIPALYKTQSEEIEISPAGTKWVKKKMDRNCFSVDPNDCLVWCLVETPAMYQTIIKKIQMDCEEGWTAKGGDCIREVEIPAEYTTRTFRKLRTAPSHFISKEIPAEYRTISKTVIKTPAQIRRIETPAEYITHIVRKLKSAASIRKEVVPVIMDQYTTQVRKDCPTGYSQDLGVFGNGDCIRRVAIPAEYTSRSYKKLVSPSLIKIIPIPAEYTTVDRQILTKKGGFIQWREVCRNSGQITHSVVRKIQDALRKLGYDPGPSDNVFSTKTKAALIKYQKDNGLSVGNVDLETLELLGVDY